MCWCELLSHQHLCRKLSKVSLLCHKGHIAADIRQVALVCIPPRPRESITHTASRSVQPFLHSSQQSVECLGMSFLLKIAHWEWATIMAHQSPQRYQESNSIIVLYIYIYIIKSNYSFAQRLSPREGLQHDSQKINDSNEYLKIRFLYNVT